MLPTRTGRRALVALGIVACCLALATSGVAAGGPAASATDDAATTAAASSAAERGGSATTLAGTVVQDSAVPAVTASPQDAPGQDDESAPPEDERVEVGDGLTIWERAFLPLRADADAAATVVPAPRVFVDPPSAPQSDLDRDRLAVYDPGTVPLELSSSTGADLSQFAGEEVQVVVVHAAPDRSGVPLGALPAGVNADALREAVDAPAAAAAVDEAALRSAVREAESGDGVDRATLQAAVDREQLADAVDSKRLADALDDASARDDVADDRLVALAGEAELRAAVDGELTDAEARRVAAVVVALAAADVEPTDAELAAAVEAAIDGDVADADVLRTALDRARVAVDGPSIAPFVGPLEPVLQPGSIADLATDEALQLGEGVEIEVDEAQLDADGTLSYDLNADEPGQYAVLVATGEPFAVDDGDLRRTGESGTVIGAEAVAVHERASDVSAPGAVTAGEAATFDVETGFDDGPANHAVVLYHEPTLLYSQTTVSLDEDAARIPSLENVTVEHSIGSVNGVARARGNVTLAGVGELDDAAASDSSTDADAAGTIDLRGLLATAATETGAPVEDRVVLGDQVLDASATAVANGGADATVSVETLANVTPGTYRYVHVATDWRDSGSVETNTGTIEVRAPGGTPSDGDENGSGEPSEGRPADRGDSARNDGPPLCPPSLWLQSAGQSLSLDGASVHPALQPLRADDVPAGVRVCRSLGRDDGGTGFAFTSVSFDATAAIDVDATLRRASSRPDDVEALPTEADGLSYLTVEHGEELASAAEDVELTVRVDRERLAAADRTLDDVRFYRHDGEEWSELNHSVGYATSSHATLVVESPGLSTFAATYRDAAVSEGETPSSPGAEASVVRVASASVQPTTAYANDLVEITASIRAEPPAAQEHVATLAVDGRVVEEERVALGEDGTATVAFEHAFDGPGTYELSVDGEPAGTVTVQERATVAGSAEENGLPATLAIAMAVVGVLAIAGGYLFWRVGMSDSPSDPL